MTPLHLTAISCPKLRKLEIYFPHPFDDIAGKVLRGLLDSSEGTNYDLAELKITSGSGETLQWALSRR